MAAIVWALGAWCASGAVAAGEGAAGRLIVLPPIWVLAVLVVAAVGVVRSAGVSRAVAAPLWVPAISVLPLAPLPLPAAVLLWIGPLGQVLAAIAAVLVVVPALWSRTGTRGIRPRWPAAVVLLAATFTAAAWSIAPRIPGGDEPHYLIITQSLLNDGDLRIEDNHDRREYAAYVDGTLRPDYLRRGRDGAIYSIHAPGVSALVLPAFAAGGYPAVVVLLAVLSALGLAAVWRAADAVATPGAARFATAAVGLSVPFFFQSMTVYPDGPAAVAVGTVVWLAMVRGVSSWQMAVAAGLMLGGLPWLHTRYAAIAGPLGAIVAARILWPGDGKPSLSRGLRLAAFAAPAIASALLWFGLFQAIYGTWDPRAPYGHATDMRVGRIPHGIAGLLLDQQFGLLANAPVYLLAIAGLVPLWQRHRRIAVEMLLLTTPYLVAVAGFHMWWGGRSSPVRFLVPVLLPLAIPIAAWWASPERTRTGRAAGVVLLAASLLLTATFVLVDRGALVYNSRDGHALWLLSASAPVNLTSALPSLFQGGPAEASVKAALWLLAAGAVLAGLHRFAGRLDAGRWPAAVLAGVVVAVSSASTLGWAAAGVSGHDRGAGMLDAVARGCAAGTIAVRTSPIGLSAAPLATAGVTIDDASRRPLREALLWAASGVPPGRYRIDMRSGLNVTGTATVALGRPDAPLSHCTFSDRAPGPSDCEIDLPAGASALWITGDATLRRTTESAALTLVSRNASSPCEWRAARAAVRDGRVLFVIRGQAWVEGAGLWTAAGGVVTIAASAEGNHARLHVRQGAAAGDVRLRSDGWSESRRLEAGESWDAVVPVRAGADTATVEVETPEGFRPTDVDPASADLRRLGAWVEPR